MQQNVQVEIFKTSINNRSEANQVEILLTEKFPDLKINFDLDDCDRILRIESESIDITQIIDVIRGLDHRIEILH